MNSRLNYLLIGLFWLLLPTVSVAQEWSFGPKAYLGVGRSLTIGDEATLPIGSISTVADGDATLSGLGVFARYDRSRWYAEINAIQGRSYGANLNVSTANASGPLYPRARRYDARLIVGYKPLPWMRLSAGLVGVANNWSRYDYDAEATRFETQAQAATDPATRTRLLGQANNYRLRDVATNALKQNVLEAQLSIGADMGGFTLDLNYNPGLTPVVDGVTYLGRTYALEQRAAFWSLGVGYKLFPLKKHLLAPRKNKAYARLQREIPFIRNEFSVGVGMLAEDLGSEFIYENRYTRYLSPRFGLTVGLAYQRGVSGFQADNLAGFSFRNQGVVARNMISLLPGARLLLLYSRHHRIGLGAGLQLSYIDETILGSGSRAVDINGKPVAVSYIDAQSDARRNEFEVAPMLNFDYQFLPTDRLFVGPWLCATPDFGSFGIQAGYRF